MNNQVFRATNQDSDLAVKFCIRDNRQRAWREYQALQIFSKLKSGIAPIPVMVVYQCKPNPVIVMEWLRGESIPCPPQTEEDWEKLISHYVKIHSVRPVDVKHSVRRGVVDSRYAKECLDLGLKQANLIPEELQSPILKKLVHTLQKRRYPRWTIVGPCFCRVDPNPRNFIERINWSLPESRSNVSELSSVDWINSGWGDPAFDIAGLLTHPEYMDVSEKENPTVSINKWK